MNRTCFPFAVAVFFAVCTGPAWASPLNPRPLTRKTLPEGRQMRSNQLYAKPFTPRQYSAAPSGYRAPNPVDPWRQRR